MKVDFVLNIEMGLLGFVFFSSNANPLISHVNSCHKPTFCTAYNQFKKLYLKYPQ